LSVPRSCQSNNRPHPDFRVDATDRLLPRPPRSVVKHRALPVSAAASCGAISSSASPIATPQTSPTKLMGALTVLSRHRGRPILQATAEGTSPLMVHLRPGPPPSSPPRGPRWHRAALQPIQRPLDHRSGLPSSSPPTDRALPWSANHGEPFPPSSVKLGSPHRWLPL
jgi:hypothetical protein